MKVAFVSEVHMYSLITCVLLYSTVMTNVRYFEKGCFEQLQSLLDRQEDNVGSRFWGKYPRSSKLLISKQRRDQTSILKSALKLTGNLQSPSNEVAFSIFERWWRQSFYPSHSVLILQRLLSTRAAQIGLPPQTSSLAPCISDSILDLAFQHHSSFHYITVTLCRIFISISTRLMAISPPANFDKVPSTERNPSGSQP